MMKFNLFNMTQGGLINKAMQHLFNTVPQIRMCLTMRLSFHREGH